MVMVKNELTIWVHCTLGARPEGGQAQGENVRTLGRDDEKLELWLDFNRGFYDNLDFSTHTS